MNKKYLLLLPVFIFLYTGNGYPGNGTEQPVKVIILHTNDMHSKIDNMGKLAYLADSLRSIFSSVYLVSAGDNFTGNPVVDMVSDKGFPMIDLMNACGFDASAIGNHEFDMGQEMFVRRMSQARFPFICANIDCEGSAMKQPPAYVLLKAGNDAEIPVLGLIQVGENGLPDSHPSRFEGIKFADPVHTAGNHSDLKEKYGNLVALTHLGTIQDEELANAMPSLDLIIGGHSHTLLDTAIIKNGVMIVQAGSGLKYVGKSTLLLADRKIIDRKDEVICLDSIRKSDPEVQSMIDKYNDNPELKKVVGIAGADIVGFDGLGSLITDAQRTEMKADFAFMNRRGIRVQSLKQGNITVKDIYQMDPFQNEIVVFRMTPKEIESLICYGFKLTQRPDLAVSGMTCTIIADSSGHCTSVEMRDMEGKPLDAGKDYRVAMNSYISSSYKFDHKDPGTSSGITSEEVLIEYMQTAGALNYTGVKRVFLKQEGGEKGH